ncbi:MAG: hypothetical protein F6K47_17030 [Symploca sp. SIO2E6]|nr:hypothetical protein [Symploca sp. SIO2E6]NET57794.1 hypothetical protein [Symploca sp. SIO2E6]
MHELFIFELFNEPQRHKGHKGREVITETRGTGILPVAALSRTYQIMIAYL